MNEMKKIVMGILAHVDAGKTTLSEALLYETGQIRTLGRVDHQDAFLDTNHLERERGITIFSKQARIVSSDMELTLLDTPGHVDFSAEMERTLQVLDYGILVVSGTDGVQGHTRTLWRLLQHYHVPTFVFVNKMDLQGAEKERVLEEMKQALSGSCVDFTGEQTELLDELSMCNEEMMESYLESENIPVEMIQRAIAKREVYPCFFGSALKLEGIDALLKGIRTYSLSPDVSKEFGARVYKIGRDAQGNRLTYMKVTGGKLRVKETLSYGELSEKVDQIRLYSGEKFEAVQEVTAGEVCAVTGLTATVCGMGIGVEHAMELPVLEPVLNYRIHFPKEINPNEMYRNMKLLEEEDPQLHILWKEELGEIHVQMMGQVQLEILTQLIKERFGVVVVFDHGNIVYKETIAKPVEGVGHFEPLRHYAEAHVYMEPGEPGSGIQVNLDCSEDELALNWQRLIATHIEEKEHTGVLTGSALTDVRFTVVGGRAHNKHTEGGDFRQATYRAIRQGLKSTECLLLEPIYRFCLEVPVDAVGRAMSDMRQKCGEFDTPEFFTAPTGEMARLVGTVPVSTMGDYMKEVHGYTKGMGQLMLTLQGYDVCHNSEEVIASIGYDSEADTANPTGSVFCGHGAGFVVPWNQVPDYMHVPYCMENRQREKDEVGFSYDVTQAIQRSETPKKTQSAYELDKELQQIYQREFGAKNEDDLERDRKKWRKTSGGRTVNGKEITPSEKVYSGKPTPRGKDVVHHLVVDGYNVIFALEEYKSLASMNLDSAKGKLLDDLVDYKGYKQCKVTVVFDAYKKKEHPGSEEDYQGIRVIYTKTDVTADTYIEQLVHKLGQKEQITVATNDGLEQLTIMGQGALRMTAANLREEMKLTRKEQLQAYQTGKKEEKHTLGEITSLYLS